MACHKCLQTFATSASTLDLSVLHNDKYPPGSSASTAKIRVATYSRSHTNLPPAYRLNQEKRCKLPYSSSSAQSKALFNLSISSHRPRPDIVMGNNEQVRPLAPAGAAGDEEGARTAGSSPSSSSWSASKKLTKRRRSLMCLGCCGGSIAIVGVLILVLALTVFKVKDPIIAVNSLKLDRLSFNSSSTSRGGGLLSGGDVTLNLTLSAGISIKNPNAVSFKFGNSTTSVSYRGKTVAQVHGPGGKAGARKTMRMNVTVDVLADQLTMANGNGDLTLLLSDLASGTLTVNSHTNVGGRVSLLRIIKRHVDVVVNCTILVSVSNQNIQNLSCIRKVKM